MVTDAELITWSRQDYVWRFCLKSTWNQMLFFLRFLTSKSFWTWHYFLPHSFNLGAKIVRGSEEHIWGSERSAFIFWQYSPWALQIFSGGSTCANLWTCTSVNATRWSHDLTVARAVCVVLCFFTTGTYMHSVGDAENPCNNTLCHSSHSCCRSR